MDGILIGWCGVFLQIKLCSRRNTLCISNEQSAELEEKNRHYNKMPSKEMILFPEKRKKRKAESLPLRFFLP